MYPLFILPVTQDSCTGGVDQSSTMGRWVARPEESSLRQTESCCQGRGERRATYATPFAFSFV